MFTNDKNVVSAIREMQIKDAKFSEDRDNLYPIFCWIFYTRNIPLHLIGVSWKISKQVAFDLGLEDVMIYAREDKESTFIKIIITSVGLISLVQIFSRLW